MKVDAAYITKLAKKIDMEKGDKSHAIDTDDEISLFTEQLEKKGVKNAKKIVSDYTSNGLKFEADFAKNGKIVGNNTEYAIYAALNPKSNLVRNKELSADVDDIVKNIEDAVTGWWFFLGGGTKENKLEKNVNRIDKDNVLQVLDSYEANFGETLAYAINDDTSGEFQDKLGTTLIKALVEKADEFGIDVTSLISMNENGEFTTVNIPGVKPGESATNDDNFEKVVEALQNILENSLSIISGDADAIKNNKEEAILLFARQADTDNNGELKDDEVGFFKKLCADVGIFVNDILSSIADKDSSNYTTEEKLISNIFAEGGYKKAFEQKRNMDFAVNTITTAVKDKDKETLANIINADNITADNVEELLSNLDDNEKGIVSSLVTNFGDDSKQFTSVILKALIDKADDNYIDVSDIVKVSNGEFYTASEIGKIGKNALDKEYINDVIDKLRERIKEETDYSDIDLD